MTKILKKPEDVLHKHKKYTTIKHIATNKNRHINQQTQKNIHQE